MNKDLINGLKEKYINYLDDVLSNRSLCVQIKLNMLTKYFNKIIDMMVELLTKNNLYESILSINNINNFSFNDNNNMNNNMNNNINNYMNNMNNNINNNINNNMNNMNNNINNNVFIDNMNDNNIIIDDNRENIYNNDNIDIDNIDNINNNNMNNNNNQNNNNDTFRKIFYILKIDDKKKLKNILTYLDNLDVKYLPICYEQIENKVSTFWLLLEFLNRYQLNNTYVYYSIFKFKGYHRSDYYNFVISKGRRVNLQKIKNSKI